MEAPNIKSFYKLNEKFIINFNPPGVDVHCLYGSGINTAEKYKLHVKFYRNIISF